MHDASHPEPHHRPAAAREPARPSHWRSVTGRAAALLVFWLVLTGVSVADLPIGAAATLLATWVSLRLVPAGQFSIRPLALARLLMRFLQQSIAAGIDVAWRAFDPRLPLQPGIISYCSPLPPGPRRNAFLTLTSLLPGTLPCASDDSGNLAIHCLDVGQPVASSLAAEEALFVRAVGSTSGNG
jgi:multicomponent Na+:H+ antiporter subunit E